MAAGAYKGLTIRIGADTTKLTTALRSANGAIYKTQSELNKLSKALKMDPGNSKAMSLQMGRMSEQAINIAKQIDVTKKGMEKLAEVRAQHLKDGKVVSGESIKELADGTEDAIGQAARWNDKYNEVNASLHKAYTTIKDITGIDLAKASRNGFGKEFGSELGKAIAIAKQNGKSIDAEVNSIINDLKPAWQEATAEKKNYEDAAKLKELNDTLVYAEAHLKSVSRDYAEMAASESSIARSSGLRSMQEGLRDISKATETAGDRFKRLNEAAKLNPGSLSTAIARSQALREALSTTNEKAKNLRQQLDAYKANGIADMASKVKDSALALEQATSQVAKLKRWLEVVKVVFGENSDEAKELQQALEQALKDVDTAKAVNEFKELEVQLREVEAESKTMRSSLLTNLQGVGTAAVQAATEIGNLARQIGQEIVTASNDIDASYRDLRKTFDATEGDYQKLYDAAMKYSQAHVTSADTMLEMEAIAAQLGVGIEGGADAIQKFADAAANLDVATDIEAEEIALKMGQIVNVMSDLRPDNVVQFADALVNLGNKMPAQESAIMQITQRLSAIGDVANFTTPELLSWSAAIASTGQRSEAAASGISTTITTIAKAVGAGGDDLETFARIANMSADEFKSAWSDEPGGASRALYNFIKGLGDLDDAAFQQLEDLGMSGVRQTQTLVALANTLTNVDKAMDVAAEGWNNGGQAADEANKKAQGFSGSLAKMQNSAQVLAATLGDALAPFIDDVAELLQQLTDALEGMDDETKQAIVKWGALSVAFSTAYPIVSSLGGALLTLATNTKTLVVGALGSLFAKAKDAYVLFGAAGSATEALSALFPGAAAGATKLSGALAAVAGSGALVVGALGAIALAVGAVYIKKWHDAKKAADEYKAVCDGLKDTTKDLAKEMILGADAAEKSGRKWTAARVDMEDYHNAMQDGINAQAGAREEMTATVGELNRYQEILGKAVGRGQTFAGNMGELQWAVDRLNEATGESWSVNDVLTGKYQDESGAVHDLTGEIDQLIEAKKREAQISGLETMLSENVAMQERNKLERQLAAASYQNYVNMKLESDARKANAATANMSDTEYIAYLQKTDEHMQGLLLDSKNLREESRLLGQQYEDLTGQLAGWVTEGDYTNSAVSGMREGIIKTSEAMRTVASDLHMSEDEFSAFAKVVSQRIEDCGVSVEDFANIDMNDLSEAFRKSGGDANAFVQEVLRLNGMSVDDKYAGFHFDEEGNLLNAENQIVEWNEKSQSFEPVKIEADTSQLDLVVQQVSSALNMTPEEVRSMIVVEETGADEAVSKNQEVDSTMTKIDRQVDPKVNIHVSGKTVLDEAARALRDLNGKNYTSTYTVIKENITRNRTEPGFASGAYIPYNRIPRHAAGIFTRPTLTNIGWVGEDGAELYSGNSLVPLTNRKYSMPYINDISDAVARKLGSAGNSYNLYIDDARINDDPAIQAAMLDLFATLQRRGAMNVG